MAISNETKSAIKGFDVNSDTQISLNCSKVPAQDGVFSLVLSGGGTGLDALLEAKGLINMTCCESSNVKDKPTKNVAYRCFDTDNRSKTIASSARTGGAKLDPNNGEFQIMKCDNMRIFLAPEYRQQVPSYISSWLDFSIPNDIDGSTGAGGYRQAGRLLMFQCIEEVRNSIRNAINGLIAGQVVNQINIYVLAGIGGGTGSGIFVDLAYIARQVVEEIHPTNVAVYGYLFLPDVNLSRAVEPGTKQYIQKNGYAALKELDHLMSLSKDGSKFSQQYSNSYTVEEARPPFNYVHLISARGADGMINTDPYHQGMWAVAQSILSFIGQEHLDAGNTQFAMSSYYVNINRSVTMHPCKFPERAYKYLALGTYSYELPVDKILLYVTSLLFENMNAMYKNSPDDAQEIEKHYRALGLQRQVMIAMLQGTPANLAPQGATWEDLFGQNPRYNLAASTKTWIERTALNVTFAKKRLIEEFEEKFLRFAEIEFTNPAHGPVWFNHLLVQSDPNKKGFFARILTDLHDLEQGIANQKHTNANNHAALNKAFDEGKRAGALFGGRDEKRKKYIDAVNVYADGCVRLAVLEEMGDIYKAAHEVMTKKNDQFFSVVVDVLEALKEVCNKNASILTETTLSNNGHTFTWQPLSIPDISGTIQELFNKEMLSDKNEEKDVILSFTKALIAQMNEWSKGNPDVKTFIRDYIDNNLSKIANESLESYITKALKGADLDTSVQTILAPMMTSNSAPLFNKSMTADTGGQLWMVSIPTSCPNILQAFKNYVQANPSLSSKLTIQSTGINNRIFMQSVLSAVPLCAYAPLTDYEAVYLGNLGSSGLHLFMNEKGENWQKLPTPIPQRSRPQLMGAYPQAVKDMEDAQRALFKQCRTLPIISTVDGTTTQYRMRIAENISLDPYTILENFQDYVGKWDLGKIATAIAHLKHWYQAGLPILQNTDSAHEDMYEIASCAIPEQDAKDERETEAMECFLGEYSNVRRAKEELAKYEAVKAALDGLLALQERLANKTKLADNFLKAAVSSTISFKSLPTGQYVYQYTISGNTTQLAEVTEAMGHRDFVAAQALEALSQSENPYMRQSYDVLIQQAQTVYQEMNIGEKREKKLDLLKLVQKGVQDRLSKIEFQLSTGTAHASITSEVNNFYKDLNAAALQAISALEEPIPEVVTGGDEIMF